MTLPNEEVMELLDEHFVLMSRNIEREHHVGMSHGYKCDQTAVGTTNGAGGRNVQMLVLATDETVVHALPGFWHAADLVPELRLGLDLHRLHRNETLTTSQKLAMFAAMHRAHLHRHGAAAKERGAWQNFDVAHELMRSEREPRDTVIVDPDGPRRVKPIVELVHERLLARPFRPLREFGLDAFVDYGRPYYDNNAGLDDGRNFPRAEQANGKRERQREKEAAAAEKAAKAAAKKEKTGKAGDASRDATGKSAKPSTWRVVAEIAQPPR